MTEKKLEMKRQPTDSSCGPTCLKAVYDYYDYPLDHLKIIKEVKTVETGGTLAPCLGIHALDNGFDVTIYTFNLEIFDPTWFFPKTIKGDLLKHKLALQMQAKANKKLKAACKAFIEFIEKGGKVKMQDLSGNLIMRYLRNKTPIILGLSSTYLYRTSRDLIEGSNSSKNDVLGTPEGHFVVLESYDPGSRLVTLRDPWIENPYSQDLKYQITKDHLLTSFLMGLLTYDANLTVIERKKERSALTKGR